MSTEAGRRKGQTAPEEAGSPRAPGGTQWSVYLLTCADGTLYCGVTTDVTRRLAMHNGLLPGGARYTSGRRPAALTAVAGGLSRSEALRLEARIKRLPREKKVPALEAVRAEPPVPHKA